MGGINKKSPMKISPTKPRKVALSKPADLSTPKKPRKKVVKTEEAADSMADPTTEDQYEEEV